MDPNEILLKHYGPGSAAHRAYDVLLGHSERVAKRAVDIARSMGLDGDSVCFIYESAMLHDIGICLTNVPALGCHGDEPYIRHGVLGRQMIEAEGLSLNHARICETHVGAGLTASEIRESKLPLPIRDMLPACLEEKIVCVADKFYRKTSAGGHVELSVDEVIVSVSGYGQGPASRFDLWLRELGITG